MTNHPNRSKINWDGAAQFSIEKASEGGMGGSYALFLLKDMNKIPARRCYSPYVGQTGVEVPKKFARKAAKLLGM